MGWIYLLGAGIFEIGFTTWLKLSDGFSKLLPTVGFILSAIVSFWLLTKALQTVPLGTSYAVWTGIDAFGTAIIGIIFFKDPVTFGRILFLFVLIASIFGLRYVSST